jgi:hypothetical protein
MLDSSDAKVFILAAVLEETEKKKRMWMYDIQSVSKTAYTF